MTVNDRIAFSSFAATPKTKATIAQKIFGWIAAAKNYDDANDISRRLRKQGVKTDVRYINDNLFHVVMV
jgi:hypothetical protein